MLLPCSLPLLECSDLSILQSHSFRHNHAIVQDFLFSKMINFQRLFSFIITNSTLFPFIIMTRRLRQSAEQLLR